MRNSFRAIPFSTHLLNTYFVPCTVLDLEHTGVNKTGKATTFMELVFSYKYKFNVIPARKKKIKAEWCEVPH